MIKVACSSLLFPLKPCAKTNNLNSQEKSARFLTPQKILALPEVDSSGEDYQIFQNSCSSLSNYSVVMP
jgi:hypothetical protein